MVADCFARATPSLAIIVVVWFSGCFARATPSFAIIVVVWFSGCLARAAPSFAIIVVVWFSGCFGWAAPSFAIIVVVWFSGCFARATPSLAMTGRRRRKGRGMGRGHGAKRRAPSPLLPASRRPVIARRRAGGASTKQSASIAPHRHCEARFSVPKLPATTPSTRCFRAPRARSSFFGSPP